MTLRLLPILTFGLFFAVGFVWRSIHQLRQHGTLGFALFAKRPILAAVALVVPGIALAQAVLFATMPETVEPMAITLSPLPAYLGAGAVVIATIAMAIAQLDLGASWRVGIDPMDAPGLVTTGLYRISRNPIFLFALIACAGMLLTMPTWPSMFLFFAILGIIRAQVREEEEWLASTYGDAYRGYAAQVGRFLPWFGRLRGAA